MIRNELTNYTVKNEIVVTYHGIAKSSLINRIDYIKAQTDMT